MAPAKKDLCSITTVDKPRRQGSQLPRKQFLSENAHDALVVVQEPAILERQLKIQNDLLMQRFLFLNAVLSGPPGLILPHQSNFGSLTRPSLTLESGATSRDGSGALESSASDTDSIATVSTPSWRDDTKRQDHHEVQTTIVVKNLSADLSRDDLLKFLDSLGFHCKYDFLYLPVIFGTRKGCHYAFVNFLSTSFAQEALSTLAGITDAAIFGDMSCEVSWSDCQGSLDQVAKYRNSPVMHSSVPEDCRPLLFSNGKVAPFPKPTKKISKPRNRRFAKPQYFS